MYSLFPKNLSVMTVVILANKNGRLVPGHKFRMANSRHDIPKHFAVDRRTGQPIIGPRVYRERTKRELAEANLVGADYMSTLVPLSNVEGVCAAA